MKHKLFGTDGMRGEALHYPLDRATVSRLGKVLANHLGQAGLPLRILLAGDTRASTPQLAKWLGGAFVAAGGEVVWAGVLPTPAVSHLIRDAGDYGAGVVVSASHNPAADNGIKLVAGTGTKWPTAAEAQLEEQLLATPDAEVPVAPLPSLKTHLHERYVELLLASLPERALQGLHIVVDAANGAAAPFAGEFFTRLGARVDLIHCSSDGLNINRDCGALHPEELAATVVQLGANAGVAFDGDADRAALVSHTGRILDGDNVILMWAKALNDSGRLPGRRVVATVMSNVGLEVRLAQEGMSMLRCPVGDREVWETMQREGAVLGGEQSGHVICSHYAVTGDGLLTAAQILAIAHAAGRPLETLADLVSFPQVLKNVKVKVRRPIDVIPELADAVKATENDLAGHGRVLLRYSGTEALLRIMIEASDLATAERHADHLVTLARLHLGG